MGYRYDVNERVYGGSMSQRLNPDIARTGLNQKIGADMPRPMVHCNDKAVPSQQGGRLGRIRMPDRFRK